MNNNKTVINHEQICKQAWALYHSPKKEKIADYTKYDALFEVTKDMNLSDEEYDELLDEMQYE